MPLARLQGNGMGLQVISSVVSFVFLLNNSKSRHPELLFLHSASSLMLVNICMKFHEATLNGF